MLKNVPKLLEALCAMGHGDTLVIADGNFPAESMGKDATVIRMDGHEVPPVLDAVLRLIPLDEYVPHPIRLMQVVPGDDVQTPIWSTYREIVARYDARGAEAFEAVERFAFYAQARKASVIIATSERAPYANVLLQKGVLKPEDYVPVYPN